MVAVHSSWWLYSCWQAWAVASGKINEFPNDKARWKTNFRCALNNLSVRFKMVQDNSKNSDDPHKIYEIINTDRECDILSIPRSVQSLVWNSKRDLFLVFLHRLLWKSANTRLLSGGFGHDSGDLQLSHRVLPLRKWGTVFTRSPLSLPSTENFFVILCELWLLDILTYAFFFPSKQQNLLRNFTALDLGNNPSGTGVLGKYCVINKVNNCFFRVVSSQVSLKLLFVVLDRWATVGWDLHSAQSSRPQQLFCGSWDPPTHATRPEVSVWRYAS